MRNLKSSFRDIVRTCPVPILVAGREKVNNDSEILQMISDAMDAGARGVIIGRNVFQSDDIVDILGRICSIVHLGERNV
ncbi:MAG: hypothetical protein GY751_23150 [Bacteroidetes bacterium]|nr:hypothetical protein [Bacteroidota bacterium]